jgi:peptide deformylase
MLLEDEKMALLPIRFFPDPVLRTKCDPVEEINDNVRQMLAHMLDTMYANDGGGLAANQVGYTLRMIVTDPGDGSVPKPIKLINPKIVWRSKELKVQGEGCLSLPGVYPEVTRSAEVNVQYYNELGEMQEVHATGYLSACLQHELDHLDGILSIDYLSELKRKIALRRIQKNVKLLQRKED